MYNHRGFSQPSCPSSVEISSGRDDWPCRREHSCRVPSPPDQTDCPHRSLCRSLARHLGPIEAAYGPSIKVTLSETSTSIVVRAEQQFHHEERHRLTLRKHFCELIADASPATGLVMDCQPFRGVDEKFGQYLGFVDLRTTQFHVESTQPRSPIAMGLLAPPRKYRNNPDVVLITNNYGPLFGGPAVDATLYSMHDELGGAMCAQASITMAVGMLCDRGARVKGEFTVTYLGSDWIAAPAEPPNDCIARRADYPIAESFIIGGLRPDQCLRALDSPGTGVAPRLVWVQIGENRISNSVLERIIRANLRARFPVIAFVSTSAWYDMGEECDDVRSGHAVVLIGYRRLPRPEPVSHGDEERFIVHDPGQQPFDEVTVGTVFDSAWRFQKNRTDAIDPILKDDEHLFLLPVADCRIHIHLDECIRYLRSERFEASDRLRAIIVEMPDWYQDTCAAEFQRFAFGLESADGHELEMDLIDRQDLGYFLADSESPPVNQELRRHFKSPLLEGRRFWAVSGRRWQRLEFLVLFDAECECDPDETDPGGRALRLALVVRTGPNGAPAVQTIFERLSARAGCKPEREAAVAATPDREELPELEPCVMTSCSDRPLREFLADVTHVSGVRWFEPLLLRNADINELRDRGILSATHVNAAPTRIVADDDLVGPLTDWLASTFNGVRADLDDDRKPKIACLATYFPDVSSPNEDSRRSSVRAIANSVRIALELESNGLMPNGARVEIVAGARVDACPCAACKNEKRCFTFLPEVKRRLLLDSLRDVVRDVRNTHPDKSFQICVEVEPGETYFVNRARAIDKLLEDVESDADQLLQHHVFLNLDITHMMSCTPRVSADRLARWRHRIAHSHACDQPSMHTIDQPLGVHNAVCQFESEYLPYFRVLAQAARDNSRSYSGVVSVELEANDRNEFIYRSVSAVRHLAGLTVQRG
jgi:sugar phosphate isomerase/epimerase